MPSPDFERRLAFLRSNVFAEIGVAERIERDLAFGKITEGEARRQIAKYERALSLSPLGFSARRSMNPDLLSIWKPGFIRVFVSHRDRHKLKAHALADALDSYGFSCFVAHDAIHATDEWRRAILNGLETMDAMLIFLTDDFSDSIWAMQEVGYALGKGVPYVSLKLETRDPPGFISHTQALRGSVDDPQASARQLARLLSDALGRRERLQTALVAAFAASPSRREARARFERLVGLADKLSDGEVDAIVQGFRRNEHLHGAAYLRQGNYARLCSFLDKVTDRQFSVRGRSIYETGNSGATTVVR